MWVNESNYNLKLVNQIFLFINVYTSIVWIITSIYVFYKNSSEVDFFSLNFPLICFCIGFPVEGLRLYLGYSGNIRNNVLDLAGFLILTTFIEFPIHTYLLLSLYESRYHVALVVQAIQLILLPVELFLNFIIVRRSLHERNLQFQMMYSAGNKLQ